MGIASELSDIKTDVSDKVVANKVARFAYKEQAYTDNDANGVNIYNPNQDNNIPVGTASIMKVNQTVLELGWRARASSITRMLMNHFLGRISYNLNKANDMINTILSTFLSYLGQPNGVATLDNNGHLALAQQSPVGSPYVPVTRNFLGAVFSWILGRRWKKGTISDTSGLLEYLVYANGLWVCGSRSNGCWWSEDGKSWTQGTGSNTSYGMRHLAYRNGLWVCGSHEEVGSGNGYGVWWSEDGKAWTQGTSDDANFASVGIKCLVYAGGAWVCGSYRGCYRSLNGKDWTLGTFSSGYNISDLVYANGLWVSTSNNGCLYSETFGTTWSQGTGGNTSYSMSHLVYANGLWVCCSYGHGCWWSTDGKAWTQGTGSNTSSKMEYLVYANGLWVCGSEGEGCWWSANGKSWTQGTGGNTSASMQYLVYASGLWVCGSYSNGVWWSEDGKSWTQGTGSNTSVIRSVTYANSIWLCSCQVSESVRGCWWSEDGKSWTRVISYTESNPSSYSVYANGTWVHIQKGVWYSSLDDFIADGTINLGADVPLVDA